MRHTIRKFVYLSTLLFPVILSASECDFDCTLQTHLDAIQERNFEAFVETITLDEKLSFILPNGMYFEKKEAFVKMLKGWFAEDGWHFNYKIIRKIVGEDIGMALLLVSYDEDDRDGKPYHIDHYLNLVFQKKHDSWRLIHDQNTKTELVDK